MGNYDHPNFLVVRERHLTGAISAAGLGSTYVGSSLKVAQKAIVLGCTFRVGSGGSASGTNSFKIARTDLSGTISNFQVLTQLISAGASALNEVYDISLNTLLTIASLGEGAALVGQAASLDKVAVLNDVVWRYRILPPDIPQNANQG